VPPLDDPITQEQLAGVSERLEKLEKDFIVYQETEAHRQDAMLTCQNKNTEALLLITKTIEDHVTKSTPMIDTFENIQGSIQVLDWLGRTSAVVVKIALAVAAVAGVGILGVDKLGK